ncbi:MAG: FHA domain-containing protein [Polyangiaceae bacterium]|nr:FHA domain-containing protein [Polyangiaceae bacterium]
MTADPNKKTPRSFQCRDSLWHKFEQMARELECSVDYLINDAMKQYARQRGYSSTSTAAPMPAGALPPPTSGGQPSSGQPAAAQPAQPGRAHPPAPPATSLPPLPPPAHHSPGVPLIPPAPHPPALGPASPPAAHAPPPPVTAIRRPGSGALPAPKPSLPPPVPPGPLPAPNQTLRLASPPPIGGRPSPPPAPPVRGTPPPPLPPAAGGSGHAAPGRLSIYYAGERFGVNKDRFIIGRGKQSSDLTIKDPNVSRQHAMVEFLNGQYYIVDMGSTNGVEYAGQRVQRKVINEGDVFKVCDHELRFSFH